MRLLMLSYLVALTSLAQPAFAREEIKPALCEAQIGECAFYSCTQKTLGCAKDHELVSLGQRYCEVYRDNMADFSPEAQESLKRIKSCLQRKISLSENLSCDNAERIFAQAHISCYIDNGYCDLSEDDQFMVFWLGARGLWNGALRESALQISSLCSQKELKQ